MKKISQGILWFLSAVFIFGGVVGLTQGDWLGLFVLITGFCLLPLLQKWFAVKSWHQVLAGILIFFIASGVLLDEGNNTEANSASNTPTPSVFNVPEVQQTKIERIFNVKFTTGDEYTGKIDGNLLGDEGSLTYVNIGTYTGAFKNGKRNGTGAFAWENGDVYNGNWENDYLSGDGEVTFHDGIVLTAQFLNNNIVSGDYTWNDSKGSYKLHVDNSSSEPVFAVKINYANGVTYEGGFAEGNLSGKGNMVYPEIGTYIGEFKNGNKHGEGQFIWNDGDKFSGIWDNDLMNGHGNYTFADGSTLVGTFKANSPSGTLIYTYQGIKYNTVWKNRICTNITKA